ncbi:MAG: nucleotidyltransferase domain-containing protein [Rickettsia endosymbiont of Sergentomyia squamirostris]|uniref:Nucleotidyltransferase domain-containing protein n=1 Tax=Candidatus Tisiphia endosymbiont of Sergentomyia squamirostris TaxID=3113639 RepID=A0AAT9G8M5_9RICK
MINLEQKDFLLLKSILKKYPYTFQAYGSRVKGGHRKFSDLDLCVMELISDEELLNLQEELEESNLPIKVDVKRWLVDMNEDFRSLIENDLIPLE